MSIFYKTQSQELANRKAKVLVRDVDPNTGEPVRVLRQVISAYGQKSGKNSYWGVNLDKPLADGSTGVSISFIELVLA